MFNLNTFGRLQDNGDNTYTFISTDPSVTNITFQVPEFDPSGGIVAQNVTINGQMNFGETVLVPTLTGNVDNYAPPNIQTKTYFILNATNNVDMSGLEAPSPVTTTLKFFTNISNKNVKFKHESASSLAQNRFSINADKFISPNETIGLIYDSRNLRWRIFMPL